MRKQSHRSTKYYDGLSFKAEQLVPMKLSVNVFVQNSVNGTHKQKNHQQKILKLNKVIHFFFLPSATAKKGFEIDSLLMALDPLSSKYEF